jgi:glutathione S-transferase
VVRASTWEADSAQAELQRANPLGQIPALLAPDGSVLTESAAILIHLGLANPASGLLPAEEARAGPRRSGRWCSSPPIATPPSASSTTPSAGATATDAATLDAVRAGARARLHRYWELFADQFAAADTAFLGGAEPKRWTCWRLWCRAGRVLGPTCVWRGLPCWPRCNAWKPIPHWPLCLLATGRSPAHESRSRPTTRWWKCRPFAAPVTA